MNYKARFSAMAVHGVFSIVLLCIALLMVYGIWYPSPLAKAMGVTHIFWLMLTIDLILGPLLTFAVFNKNKKELKFDLLIIVLVQLAAYLYGLHTVAQGRPVWQVFVVDDIELVRAVDIVDEAKADAAYHKSLFKKPQWVSAVYSTDPKLAEQQKQDEMFGSSLAVHPETYQPLAVQSEQIHKKLKPMKELSKYNAAAKINSVMADYKQELLAGYLPVKGFEEDMISLVDLQMQPVAVVDLRPWN